MNADERAQEVTRLRALAADLNEQADALERIAICSVCGVEFEQKIKTGRHTTNYCPEHKIEGDRKRKREWARRQASEGAA